MAFNLPRLARQRGRRKSTALRAIVPTQAQALDLANIIAPAWQIWRSAKQRILAGYEPAPLTDGLTTDSLTDIVAAINETAAELLTRLSVEIQPGLRRWVVRTELWHRRKWVSAVNAGTGVDLSTVLVGQEVEETLALWFERNVALVKDISAQAQGRIADAVYRGYQSRTPVREIAAEIDKAVGLGRDRAVRVAADQSSKLSSALDVERQLEAGLDQFKYRHGGKVHARPWHLARNGKIYYLKTGKQVDGDDVIERGDGPGEPPWCSCRRQAWIPLMDEID